VTNVETSTHRQAKSDTTRTCVGCGLRADAASMVRAVLAGGEVEFDVLFRRGGRAIGRGAHLHAKPACIAKAPRRLAHALKAHVGTDAVDLGRRLALACEGAMIDGLLGAQRRRALGPGAEPQAPLLIVATDGARASGVASGGLAELERAIAAGRAMAWSTKSELGALLGEEAVAICSVRDAGLASRLIELRAAAEAGVAVAKATREGAQCSRRPEAR
jgi:predicted RNA-binding protein YlxR (DUF448 family)